MGFPRSREYINLVYFTPEYIYLVQSTSHSVFVGLRTYPSFRVPTSAAVAATRQRQWQRDGGNCVATAEAAVSAAAAGSAAVAAAVLARWRRWR